MPRYRLGREAIDSEIALPNLLGCNDRVPAIFVRRRTDRSNPEGAWSLQSDESAKPVRLRRWVSGSPPAWHRLQFDYRDAFIEFTIRGDGREVLVRHNEPVRDGHLATLLEGPILGRALRLLGSPALHATSLSRDRRAIALIGASGAGKSSLALAMTGDGWTLLGDDLAAVEIVDGRAMLHPSCPRLRLWPDMASLAPGDVGVEPLFDGLHEMRKQTLVIGPKTEQAEALPLTGLFMLGNREPHLPAAKIESLPLTAQLATLAGNVYGEISLDKASRQREFAFFSNLLALVPLRRLTLPDDIARLPEVGAALSSRLLA